MELRSSMKEQTVLDLFTIARVCHYDSEDEEQGVEKLWIRTAAQYFEHVLRLEVVLGDAQVSYYSLYSVYTVS